MDWPEPDDAPRTPADPTEGQAPGAPDPYAALRNVGDEPFPLAPDEPASDAGTDPDAGGGQVRWDDDDRRWPLAAPAEQPERTPLTIPPFESDPPVQAEAAPPPAPRLDDSGPRGADFMAAATVSAVLEQLTSLSPRINALETALRGAVSGQLDHVVTGIDTVVANTEHLGDVVAEASRVAVAPLVEQISAEVADRLQDALGDLILPMNERLAAVETTLSTFVTPVTERLEELNDRVAAVETALRVVAGRLTQSTHLQPAVESLRRDVASLTVKADPRVATTGLLRLVRDAVTSEVSALVRDLGVLQSTVDQLRDQLRTAAATPDDQRVLPRTPAFELDAEPVRRTVRPPVPEPEGIAEHPWWRES